MASFGKRSTKRLETCHPHLRLVLDEAIRYVDFTILEGWRSEDRQNEMLETGMSTLAWPKSKHNRVATAEDVEEGLAPNEGAPLSRAVDVAMYHKDLPHVRWDLRGEFYMLGGLIRGIGAMVLPNGWVIRLGADWDRDGHTTDQTFMDLPHVELIELDA